VCSFLRSFDDVLKLVSLLAIQYGSSAKAHIVKETLRRILFLQQVLGRDGFQDVLFGRLLNLASDQKLVKHKVRLLKVENDVELANTAEIFVQELNVSMDDLQGQKLIVGGLHRAAKVKACVPLIHNFVVFPLEK